MTEIVMMRPAFGYVSVLLALCLLASCQESSAARPAAARGGTLSSASASVAGMATMRSRQSLRAPVVAPVAAATTGFCPAIDTALVDEGRDVFEHAGGCYACHGPDARGSGVAPGLTGSAWLDIDGSYPAIADVVENGVGTPRRFPVAMPAMGGAKLDGEQVCAVAAYVFSMSH